MHPKWADGIPDATSGEYRPVSCNLFLSLRNWRTGLAALLLAATSAVALAGSPATIDFGLQEVVAAGGRPGQADKTKGFVPSKASLARLDKESRVLTAIPLDGSATANAVRIAIEAAGGRVTGISDVGTGHIDAYLPVSAIGKVAGIPGIRALRLSIPHKNAGVITSEGLAPMNVPKLFSQAFDRKGAGITVGVLSDSFNVIQTHPNMADDVASDDLPGGIVILDEGPVDSADEGRGMAQIIHDVAPRARICFASAFNGLSSFAANIRALADRNGPCKADIIVDDVTYSDESAFQDGIVSQAVDDVTSRGVAYFTSAGNSNSSGYRAEYNPIAFADAAIADPLLNQIPVNERPISVHNFGTAQSPAFNQKVYLYGTFLLNWDEPTGNGAVKRDFALYIYDVDGTYLGAVDDPNASIDVPVEGFSLPGYPYRYVIGLRGTTDTSSRKTILQTYVWGNVAFYDVYQPHAPTTIGHGCAAGANTVAAVFAGTPSQPEDYSSQGPCVISMDTAGSRLKKPILRRKPDIAAPDGVSTTFFYGAAGPSGYPRFFGTSAAAPHAAAVGALIWADAGKSSPAWLADLLKKSAPAHLLRSQDMTLSFGDKKYQASLTVTGAVYRNSTNFTLTINKAPNQAVLRQMSLDLSTATKPVALVPNSIQFLASSPAVDVTIAPNTGSTARAATYTFNSGGPSAGQQRQFSFIYYLDVNSRSRLAASLDGMTVRLAFSDGHVITGKAALDKPATGWDSNLGYGLIDAYAAAILARKSPPTRTVDAP